MTGDVQNLKRVAALRALEYVREGMVLGLGSGTTAEQYVRALGERVAQGLKIVGIPSSEKIARVAREVGVPLATLEEYPAIDLTVDGADEVELSTLNAIKGRGGSLLREKIVAIASKEEILIIDESKVVSRLGERAPLPVEVIIFGRSSTARMLEALGCVPRLRNTAEGVPFVTDSGNHVLDCLFERIDDAEALSTRVKSLTGVVEHGLFVGIATRVVIAGEGGARVVEKRA